MKTSFVYILVCRDGTLYTGYTTNLKRRLDSHNKGRAAKYTRGRTPVRLAYYELCPEKGSALSREYAIKQLSRQEKLDLVANKCFSILD